MLGIAPLQVRAASLTGFIEVSYFVGLNPFDLLRRAGIPPHFLDDPENRHDAGAVIELLEDAAADSGCDIFGLLMAQSRTLADAGPIGLLLEHLSTLDEILAALQRYGRLMNDILAIECVRGRESSLLCLSVAPGYEKRQMMDLAVASGYRMLTEVLGGSWTPELVHVRRPPPAERQMFERYFAVPVEFDSLMDGYSCPSEALDAPAFAAQPRMADNARRLLELLPTRSEQGPISESVQRAIALHLPTGDATLERIASNLDMDPSVLRRRIASEGSSFEAILLETRKDVATRFLTASSRSLDFIATMTGCPSARAFSSWFETNFGQSPTAWRKERREEALQKVRATPG